jgi:preprotein translocase subunit YajC
MSALPLLALFFVAAYFLLLRPQQQRVRRQRDLVTAIGVGDNVITAGGIVGRVVGVTDHRMQLEIADGVVVEFLRLSISRRLGESDAPPWGITTGDDEEDEGDEEEEEEYGEGESESEEVEEPPEGDTEADDGSGSESGATADEAVGGAGVGSDGPIEEGAVPAPGQDPH